MNQYRTGMSIEILELNSSIQKKKKYKGEISFIDMNGLLYGTWGQFVINPEVDKIKVSSTNR